MTIKQRFKLAWLIMLDTKAAVAFRTEIYKADTAKVLIAKGFDYKVDLTGRKPNE